MKSDNLKEQTIKDFDKIIRYVLKDMKLSYRYDELYDVGLIGFVNGINNYDESKGYKYITFLYDCIKYEIIHYLQYEKRQKRYGETISLNTIIKGNTELQDLLGYQTDYEQNAYIDELIMLIEKRSEDFTDKQKIIFNHLFGFNGYKEMTPKEITEKYGFSRQSIHQMKDKILRILKNTLQKYQNNEGLYKKKPY